ncbi:MAG: hypothetical protein NC394_08490 [Bacteroides sp.]|nr:hypothetical protein [Bacteroides sp.]
MNEIAKFDYNGLNVRTIIADNEPWFVVRDICAVLGMRPNQGKTLVKHVDKDRLNLIQSVDVRGRQKKLIAVNEAGLYDVLVRSDKSEAKKFRRWVTGEVLPMLRKTGQYSIVAIPTPKELGTELARLNELYKTYLGSIDKPYGNAILKAAADVAEEFARMANEF